MISFSPCTCPAGKISRVRRSGWMRVFFPKRVLYECRTCGRQFLADLAVQTELGRRAHIERYQDSTSPEDASTPTS